MKKLILLFFCIILCGCSNVTKNNSIEILLVPCNGFSKEVAIKAAVDLENYFYNTYGICAKISVENEFKIENKFKHKKRYNATEIIKYYNYDSDVVNIFLLKDDIFTKRKNNPEYGIIGQSLLGGNVCIVSTYRIKNINNLWKVILHEFCHSYFKYKHCPLDDPKCFMKDAKGHARFDIQEYFCKECTKIINFNQ